MTDLWAFRDSSMCTSAFQSKEWLSCAGFCEVVCRINWLKSPNTSRLILFLLSSEPAVPGDEEEAAAASPEPEPEAEKEVEAAVVEQKTEPLLETQTDSNMADDQTEKSPIAAPPTAEPAAVPAEPAPAAPEENRVCLDVKWCVSVKFSK